ncbi:MAG: hypothetical protein ACI8SJ_000732 [Shewanella sp.]|jgi:hypothetical protein
MAIRHLLSERKDAPVKPPVECSNRHHRIKVNIKD